jgi:hypothetical protein
MVSLKSVEAAEGRTAHNNGWNGANGMAQRVVRTAQYISGTKLPNIQDRYTRQCQRKAYTASITGVPSLGQKGFLTASTPNKIK